MSTLTGVATDLVSPDDAQYWNKSAEVNTTKDLLAAKASNG